MGDSSHAKHCAKRHSEATPEAPARLGSQDPIIIDHYRMRKGKLVQYLLDFVLSSARRNVSR
jgi:hypothetical protein